MNSPADVATSRGAYAPSGPGAIVTGAPKAPPGRPRRDLHGVAPAGRGQPRDDDRPVGALDDLDVARVPGGRRRHGRAVRRAGRRLAMKTRPPSCHDAVRVPSAATTSPGCEATPVPGSDVAGPYTWFVMVRSADVDRRS